MIFRGEALLSRTGPLFLSLPEVTLAHARKKVPLPDLSPMHRLDHHQGGRDSACDGWALSMDEAVTSAASATPIGPSSSASAITFRAKKQSR